MSRYQSAILRPRPAKFSVGEALGIAMQGGGQYFGEVAAEQKKASAREAAKAAKLEEEERAVARQIEKENRAQAAEDQEIARVEDEVVDGEVRRVGYNSKGQRVAVLGTNPDYRVNAQGETVKLSAGGKGANPDKLTETQIKYKVHFTNLDNAANEIERLLEGEGDEKYELRSFAAFKDRVASNIPFGNYLQSEKGQRFTVATRRAAESIFKGESGAAGSDQEAARYASFIPQAGDLPETVDMKLQILDVGMEAFKAAAGMGMEPDDAVLYARAKAAAAASEAGFSETEAGWNLPNQRREPQPRSTSRLDMIRQRYGQPE